MPAHNIAADISQYYSGCYVRTRDEGQVIHVDSVGDAEGRDFRHLDAWLEEEDIHVLTEIGPVPISNVDFSLPRTVGAINLGRGGEVLLAYRVSARQWKKGLCPRTVRILGPWTLGRHRVLVPRNFSRSIATAMYYPTYVSAENSVMGEPGAVSKDLYTVSINPASSVLCTGRFAIGVLLHDQARIVLNKAAEHMREITMATYGGFAEVVIHE